MFPASVCMDAWWRSEGGKKQTRAGGVGHQAQHQHSINSDGHCIRDVQAPLAGMTNVVPFNTPEDSALRAAYHDSATLAPQAVRELVWRIMR